jgi:hypothetical protein
LFMVIVPQAFPATNYFYDRIALAFLRVPGLSCELIPVKQ